MPQPTPFSPEFNFTDFQASNPATPLPGYRVDAELAGLAATLGGVLGNLALIQRDDGKLSDGCVTVDAVSGPLLQEIAALASTGQTTIDDNVLSTDPRAYVVTRSAKKIQDLINATAGVSINDAIADNDPAAPTVVRSAAFLSTYVANNNTALLGEFSANSGTSLLGYLPAAAGITAANLQTALRLGLAVTPFLFGAVGGGTVDDNVALQAWNDWVFGDGSSYRDVRCDCTGTFGSSVTINIGPSAVPTTKGRRWNVCGDLTVVALAALTEIIVPRHLRYGNYENLRLSAIGTGGTTYSTRTCGVGIKVVNCTVARLGGLYAANTQHHGILFDSDATNFNDDLHVGTIQGTACGSGITTGGMALTANWSAPVNSGTQGSTTQYTTITVDTLPPAIVDNYGTYGSQPVFVVIGGEPRLVKSVDRVNSKLTVYPWIDSYQISLAAGTLTYIYGAAYEAKGNDSGIIHIDKAYAIDCGIGLAEPQLYGSVVNSADIEGCGIAIALGAGQGNAHLGGNLGSVYTESCTFDLVNTGSQSSANFGYLLGTYALDITKCRSIADPLLSNDLFGLNGGGLGTTAGGQGVTVSHQGHLLQWHARSLHNPETSTIGFYDHSRAPQPVTRALDSATVVLNNVADGRFNQLFGYRGNLWIFVGTGTNSAPSGTFTFQPPTKGFTNCSTTNASAVVTLSDTRGMAAGMPIAGTGIPGGTTILSVNSRTQITLSANATVTGTATLTVTGSVNGTFGNVSFSGFGGPVGFNITIKAPYELQWSVVTVFGQHRLSISALGYVAGAGGAVAQLVGKSNAVTINKFTGQVTTHNAALIAGANVTFTVNDSNVQSTDLILINLQSGNATDGTYDYRIAGVGNGTFKITVENRSGGSLSEALVFNYAIIKGANA